MRPMEQQAPHWAGAAVGASGVLQAHTDWTAAGAGGPRGLGTSLRVCITERTSGSTLLHDLLVHSVYTTLSTNFNELPVFCT